MFGKKAPEVLVAGAGPVGLFTALCLAKRGIRVQIVDPNVWEAGHSYALALHARSLHLLDELGLLQPVLARSFRVRNVAVYEDGKRRADIPLAASERDAAAVAVLPQSEFEAVLVEALAAEQVKVQWQHRLAAFATFGDIVAATVHRLDQESRGYSVAHMEWVVSKAMRVDVPFVVGADGHSSLVRVASDIEFPSVAPTRHFAVFEFQSDTPAAPELSVALHGDTTSALWPLPGGAYRWSFELRDFRAPEESREKNPYKISLGADVFHLLSPEELRRLIAERAPWFRATCGNIRWRLACRFEHRLATSYGDGRVWLAGDAAHMAGPVGIHSMNVGLLEGHHLATLIGRVLRDNAPVSTMAEYGQRWLPEWRSLHNLADTYHATAKADPWVIANRDRILPCLPASGEDLRELAATLSLAPVPVPTASR